MDLKLHDKIALVTGAGGAIGAAIAGKLVEEGSTVYVADVDEQAARRTASRLGDAAQAIRIDVARYDDMRRAVDAIVDRHHALDILVNNAGILKTASVIDSTIEDWDEVCRINLSSVYYCIKAVLPVMLRRRYGKIINISSMSAAKAGGVFGNVLYGTTKAGVVAFTKGFARELAPHGINVNAIAPGLLDTPMTREKLSSISREALLAQLPMGRLASVDDIANAVAFLASDVASYVTGDTLLVDGGCLTR
ncbi:MAG TPA: SDR family NAD(P)-dependent oxidoreductase [Casimicrobiaceae bacterium]|nr:SDR family NAD(P)-dependent oxidoreductase [Casimicrobiaceae bacterium]